MSLVCACCGGSMSLMFVQARDDDLRDEPTGPPQRLYMCPICPTLALRAGDFVSHWGPYDKETRARRPVLLEQEG